MLRRARAEVHPEAESRVLHGDEPTTSYRLANVATCTCAHRAIDSRGVCCRITPATCAAPRNVRISPSQSSENIFSDTCWTRLLRARDPPSPCPFFGLVALEDPEIARRAPRLDAAAGVGGRARSGRRHAASRRAHAPKDAGYASFTHLALARCCFKVLPHV